MSHTDGSGVTTLSNVCKVSIVRNRFIFNAGHFKSIPVIKSQEDTLPLESIDVTVDKLLSFMATNHMDMTGDPMNSPLLLVVNAGIIQVSNNEFSAKMIGQTDSLVPQIIYIREFTYGVPHGYGDAIARDREAAAADPSLAKKIAADPKAEILKLLQEESSTQPDAVGGPFTVLLLRNDGTVSDFSDQPMCKIPPEARYTAPGKR